MTMIISKTPVRLSFFGGGTDYPDYYLKHGGSVLSTTINKYIYITVNKLNEFSNYKFKIVYSNFEKCYNISEIQHPVIRACLTYLNIESPLEIHVISDLPAKSGLGSSSSFTVGLLNALFAYLGKEVSKKELAQMAIHIEKNILKERVGVQDQLAASFGGLNTMNFNKNGDLIVKPFDIPNTRLNELKESLVMYYTGITRFAHQVLEEQVENTKKNIITDELNEINKLVEEGKTVLSEHNSLDKFGEIMNKSWNLKRGLSKSISNNYLDEIYNRAIKAGALGGKLLGAGGGGFFIFYVPQKNMLNFKIKLNDLILIDFDFENKGSRIILNN